MLKASEFGLPFYQQPRNPRIRQAGFTYRHWLEHHTHTYYLPKVVLSTPELASTSNGFMYNKPWPGIMQWFGMDLGTEQDSVSPKGFSDALRYKQAVEFAKEEAVTPEEDEAWAALLAYCTKPPVDVAEQVINDMQSRREFGIKKYGRPVTPHNGRHALKDAYEEVLDLAVYLKQQLLEDGQSGVHVPGDVGRTA